MSKIETVASSPGTTKETACELAADELAAVVGGATPKLYEAACKGTHLPEVGTHLPEVVRELWRAG